jgi:hypothetical protein
MAGPLVPLDPLAVLAVLTLVNWAAGEKAGRVDILDRLRVRKMMELR